jgi:hypothetical protein
MKAKFALGASICALTLCAAPAALAWEPVAGLAPEGLAPGGASAGQDLRVSSTTNAVDADVAVRVLAKSRKGNLSAKLGATVNVRAKHSSGGLQPSGKLPPHSTPACDCSVRGQARLRGDTSAGNHEQSASLKARTRRADAEAAAGTAWNGSAKVVRRHQGTRRAIEPRKARHRRENRHDALRGPKPGLCSSCGDVRKLRSDPHAPLWPAAMVGQTPLAGWPSIALGLLLLAGGVTQRRKAS